MVPFILVLWVYLYVDVYVCRNPELLKCPEYGCNAWITEPVIIDVMGNEADGIDILERHRRGRVMAFVERGTCRCLWADVTMYWG